MVEERKANQETIPLQQESKRSGPEDSQVEVLQPRDLQVQDPQAEVPVQTTMQMPYAKQRAEAPVPPGAVTAQPGSGKAMGALICGVLAIVFSGAVLAGIILGIIALVLAFQYVKAFGKDGKATGAKVCGAIGIVLSVIALIAYSALFLFASSVVSSGVIQETITKAATESIVDSAKGTLSESLSDLTEENLPLLEGEVKALLKEALDAAGELDEEKIEEIITTFEDEFETQFGIKLEDVGIDLSQVVRDVAESLGYEGK